MAAVLLLWTAACADEPGVGMKSDVDGNKPVMVCAATGGWALLLGAVKDRWRGRSHH